MAKIHGKASGYLEKKRILFRRISLVVLMLVVALLTLYVEHLFDVIVRQWWIIVGFVMVAVGLIYLGNRMLDKADQFTRGQKGEGNVYFELEKLPSGYLVFQDVQLPSMFGNIDFVVVGPTGVFTIEVKNYTGQLTVENGVLLHNKIPFEKNPIQQVTGQWTSLKNHFEQKGIVPIPYIQPILVFAGNYIKLNFGMKPVTKNIIIIQIEWLNEVIKKNPQKLSSDEILKFDRELSKLVTDN